ncbi:MAG: oligosaccharide flippase family protein [Bacteroidales bacterium]|nr:oligosaccharide flippase family protein [Bacteroidales bacterium]
MKILIDHIFKYLNKGHERSSKAKKNIIASFGIKGVAVIIGFVKVPIILAYLDVEKYGVWLTIASVVDWVQYFDLGIGHGLRNKLAENIALNNYEKAKNLVSTSYFYLSLIFGSIGLILSPVIFFLDWQSILNVTSISNNELTYTVLAVFILFIIRFIFNLITIILKADQRPALSDVFLPISSLITLLLVIIIGNYSSDSLLFASVAITAPPVLVLFIANLLFFNKKYSFLRPSINTIDKTLFKDVFNLGLKFFLIQLAGLVMFSSSNIILTQLVNPAEVTIFNLARQYLGIPLMGFLIVLTPFWSAFTDAFVRNEMHWIKTIMKKLMFASAVTASFILLLLFMSPVAYKLWLGEKVNIPFNISIMMALYNILLVFFSPFSHFINGVSKLKLSTIIVVIKTIVFFPVALLFTHYWGSIGLIISLIIINSIPSAIFESIQYIKIIRTKANGIWDK